ncbi:isopropylmalate/homocitrate/citramalate synthase [Mycobacterium sp. JS623]|uniref:isopropylmalate/homocitrate/citramalate synthase n=1 Tax=Mycobacterium sp. JS623 TaxID=212767 RepID=UPI0002A56D85|nr:isopropylmalate/homocitrate/citramalate synthase [Mycobacterium sp. JS623]AGB22199.1 isopropylmalate/homocitrate/citramalate synthase [Mycobacterium sp. JS623]
MTASMAQFRDVTLRDGLQLTGKLVDAESKVALIRRLFELGVPELEIGSMARPDLVPPMANTTEVISLLSAEELEHCWIWVAVPRQLIRAADAGATRFQFCFSASESHNQANVNRSVQRSLDGLAAAVLVAKELGATVQLALATSFTCPFEGPVDPDRVLSIITDERVAGVSHVVLADTIGQAVPHQVAELVTAVSQELVPERIAFHGHDTWGLGVANSLAALQAGAAFVDGTLGALGGCPFAPGASGNTAIEDLLFAAQPRALRPDTFHALVALSERLLDQLGEQNRSRAVEGARATVGPFPWAPEVRRETTRTTESTSN